MDGKNGVARSNRSCRLNRILPRAGYNGRGERAVVFWRNGILGKSGTKEHSDNEDSNHCSYSS